MITTRSRSASVRAPARASARVSARDDEELRLPRPPGVFRRFWARHPVVGDAVIALLCLFLTLTPASSVRTGIPDPAGIVLSIIALAGVLAACVALFWRRRHPLVPFVLSFALQALFVVGILPGGAPLILVTAYALAVYGSSRAAWIGFGVALGALVVWGGAFVLGGGLGFAAAANAVIGAVIFGLIGTLIGVNVGGRKRYLDAIIDRSRQLLVERDQQAKLAAAAERARIAREMHDIVSHSLTVIVALSEGAAATADREQARTASTATAQTARTALTEMRAMLGVLRDDTSPLPLAPLTAPSPEETVAAAQRAGYPISLTASGTPVTLSAPIDHALSRIVQEGVTNAMRHAPSATAITVRVEHRADALSVEIVNDGVTEPGDSPGFGLRGLDERVAHVRGTIVHGPVDGGRWMLRAELPLTQEDA
ncbi:sensor histidine kinase [Microbacterium galbinum]|uniref:sensor histidine kinase n=1 Tax=Microbacterium galbinum TaxID=2851646 RepID=UPI001FFD7B82|nr:sensor histidine kinase [Microbacterium galbinum]